MQYIIHKRFKCNAICGEVNLPAMTVCECDGAVIKHDGKELCGVNSQNGHQYFARNDDGNGMLRGKITQAIQSCLAKRDNDYQARWDKIWEDAKCQQYKRKDYDDHWLWNPDFFHAKISDLKYIADLIGAKIKE